MTESDNLKIDDRKTLEKFLNKTADAMEKMRRIEGRVATDQVRYSNERP